MCACCFPSSYAALSFSKTDKGDGRDEAHCILRVVAKVFFKTCTHRKITSRVLPETSSSWHPANMNSHTIGWGYDPTSWRIKCVLKPAVPIRQ